MLIAWSWICIIMPTASAEANLGQAIAVSRVTNRDDHLDFAAPNKGFE
jgi:hypothetical protein